MDANINYNRIQEAMLFVARNVHKQPSVAEIANHVHLSEFHFQRLFKEWAGITPKKFLQFLTLKELKKEVHNTKSIAELSETVGLSSQSRVYDLFLTIEGVTPHEYRRNGMGIAIDYGIHHTPFGECFIATTEKGICALEFLDNNAQATIAAFAAQWRDATIRQNQSSTGAVVESIFYQRSPRALRVVLSGTPFQVKVWEALLKIPFGALVSYNHVAEYIGSPRANRAVGSAIGKNPIGFLIPCHRVIRSVGDIGEYKWSSERKLSLIGWEKAQNSLLHEYSTLANAGMA